MWKTWWANVQWHGCDRTRYRQTDMAKETPNAKEQKREELSCLVAIPVTHGQGRVFWSFCGLSLEILGKDVNRCEFFNFARSSICLSLKKKASYIQISSFSIKYLLNVFLLLISFSSSTSEFFTFLPLFPFSGHYLSLKKNYLTASNK